MKKPPVLFLLLFLPFAAVLPLAGNAAAAPSIDALPISESTETASSAGLELEQRDTPRTGKRRHLRMALELSTVLAVGHRWYWRDGGAPNIPDWQLSHDMSAVRTKLGTNGWRFDGNEFDINALGHPGFGTLTHFLARRNHYTLGETFLISSVTSGAWEMFVELAEYGSINDLVFTSPAGVALGETAYQIVEHWRETNYEVRAGAGIENGSAFGVVSTRGELDRVPTEGDGSVGTGRDVSYNLALASDAAGVRSVDGNAKTMLAGIYRNREAHSLVLGLGTSFDYRNRKDRTERAWDVMSKVSAGPSAELALRRGDLTVELGADLTLDAGMVRAQAYDAWRETHTLDRVRNVMQDKARPYYYSIGASLDPRVGLTYGGVRAGAAVAGSLFRSLDGADRDQEMLSADTGITDHDASANAWLGYQVGSASVVLDAAATRRGGTMGDASGSSRGTTAMVTFGYSR